MEHTTRSDPDTKYSVPVASSKYCLADLERKEESRSLTHNERQALWRLRHIDKVREYDRAYKVKKYYVDVEETRRKKRKYRDDNPVQRERDNARRAKRAKENPEREKEAQARSYAKHRARRQADNAAWRAANIEYVKTYGAQWREKTREERSAKRRAQYAADPEFYRAKQRAFNARHPGYQKVYNHQRRAWKLAAGGSHTLAETQAIFDKQGGLCANPFCEADLTVVVKHLDHIKPLSRGGSNAAGNLQFLCAPCNYRKTNFEPEHWLEREAQRAADALGLDVDEVRAAFVPDCVPAPPALSCEQV